MLTKRVIFGLIATAVFMLMLYVSLPGLVSMLISARLAGAGYSNNHIHISALGLNSVTLDSARMDADDGSLLINMQGLTVTWTLAELFDGRVKSIELASLALAIQPGSGSAKSIRIPAPAGLLALIPAQRVRVDQIRMDFPQQQTLQQISGRLDYEHGMLHAPLLLHIGVRQIRLQAEIKQDGGLRIALEQPTRTGNTQIASLIGTISRQHSALQFTGKLQADYALLGQFAGARLPGNKISGRFHADVKLAWPSILPSNSEALFAALSGEVRLTSDFMAERLGNVSQISLHGGLMLTITGGRCIWQIDKGLKAAAHWQGMSTPVSLKLPAGLSGSVAWVGQKLLLALPMRQVLQFGRIKYAGLSLPDTELRLDKVLRLSYAAASGWHVDSMALSIARQIIQWDGIRLAHQGIMLAFNEDQSWRLRLNDATLSTGTLVARAMNMDAHLSVQQDKLSARYSLTSRDGLLHLNGRAEYRLDTGNGSMIWSIPAMLFTNSHRLSAWLRLKQGIDMDAGKMSASGSSRWQRKRMRAGTRAGTAFTLNHHLEVNFQGVSGSLGESRFAGLLMRLQLAGSDVLKSSKPARLQLASFENGISIRNIGAKLGLSLPLNGRKPTLHLDDVSAQLLGGEITGTAIALDFNGKRNPFSLTVKHLDIEPILALERQEGLSGSGLLDGIIPMILTQDGITVAHGRLSARAPGGVIRYAGNDAAHALAASNTKMELVLGIFRDFHYHQMNVTADYASDGGLRMRVHLAGRNPAYAAGRSVAFNLDLEENVPKLLKSLRIDRDISKKVDERVQQRLNNEAGGNTGLPGGKAGR